MIGKTISQYKIVEKLGEGGMGVVYKAEDTKLKRFVALKFLPRETVASADAKARLLREAQAAAALDHQNICTVYEIQEVDGYTFIAMAFVEGNSVKEMIEKGPLPLENVLAIARQTAKGLAQAHKKGIIHRDIKPANLMVSAGGQVKVMDFGLSRTEGQTQLTKTGASVGTITYMSPEQARGEATDHRTDIWSFGVLLHEMIVGRLPFKGDNAHAVLYSVLNEEPEPITALRTGVPMELERVVRKAMEKQPGDRYQHVEDMLVDLNTVARQLGSDVPDSTGRVTVAGRKRGRRLGLVVGAVVVVAAILTALIVLQQDDGTTRGGEERAFQSLAVLPFENLMKDAGQDYFVDGMHEALITSLSKLGSLRVISRTSVMRYKGAETTIPEIAQTLDVDVVIEGSVLRVGDEVRITAQLIDGANDEHLWANSYDRDLRNVLALLNEVAGAIAGEVRATLTPEQKQRLAVARPVNPDAYEETLRGVHLFYTFEWDNVEASIAHFEKALELDPDFAAAHAMLAGAYVVQSVMGAPPKDVLPLASQAAQRALDLDDGLSAAHTAMGYVQLYFDWDWQAGVASFQRALEIDPNNAMARHGYADYLTSLGRLDEAVDEVKLGRKSDPFSPMANLVVIGHLYVARRYDEAIDEIEQFLIAQPDHSNISWLLRRVYWEQGRFEEAYQVLRDSPWGSVPQNRSVIQRAYGAGGPQAVILAAAERLEEQSKAGYVTPLTVAGLYAQAGRVDSAMDWLEKAEEMRAPTLTHAIMQPAFDVLRETPRFLELRRRFNLPE